jgi:hypothetical protein
MGCVTILRHDIDIGKQEETWKGRLIVMPEAVWADNMI